MQIPKKDILEIKDEASLHILQRALEVDEVNSYDTETTGLAWADTPFMQTVYAAGKGFVIDKRRQPKFWRPVAEACLTMHANAAGKIIPLLGQNLPFDLCMGRKEWDLRYAGPVEDTLIESFLLDENRTNALKARCESIWGPEASALEGQVVAWLDTYNNGGKNYDRVPFELMSHYAVQDTFLTRKLHDHQAKQVKSEFSELYQTECDLIKVLVDMRCEGVRIDVPYFEELRDQFVIRQREVSKQIFSLAGREFNISSGKQLAGILYRQLGLPIKVKTESGEPSTDKLALSGLNHPIAELLLEYTHLDTSINTFIGPWLEFADRNGCMHPNLRQTGARSGRFSSEGPNVQQIPKRTIHAKLLRKGFIYPEDKVGLALDQCQMEMIGFAHYCQDATMLAALRRGDDLHKLTAVEAKIAPSLEGCTADHRKLGKGSNFSIVYGCGDAKLSGFLSQDIYAGRYVSPTEASEIRRKYHARFPGVKTFSQRVIDTIRRRAMAPGAKDVGYVANMFGRKCHLPKDKAYVGVNRIVQSWAADQMKRGMVRAWKYAQGTDLRLYVNVHDELKTHCEHRNFKEHALELNKCLTDCPGLSVPIRTEVTWSATNWAEEQDVEIC